MENTRTLNNGPSFRGFSDYGETRVKKPRNSNRSASACDALDSYVKTRFYWEYSLQGGQGK